MRKLKDLFKSSISCQESRSRPPPAPLHPWQWPSQPWSRLHLDFARPYMGHMFLVIIDAHSKWLDAHIMTSITSKKTITVLRSVFATHGLPQKVVTDNGPSFTSNEFRQFIAANRIQGRRHNFRYGGANYINIGSREKFSYRKSRPLIKWTLTPNPFTD